MVNTSAAEPSSSTLAHVRELALEATDVAVVITDASSPDVPIVWANPAFERATGYPLDEVLGRTPTFLVGPGTDPGEAERLLALKRSGGAGTVTLLCYRADGTSFWNQVTVSPVHDDGGGRTFVVCVEVDISEQVRRDTVRSQEVASERRARNGLALLSEISELVLDLDQPNALELVGRALERSALAAARFLLCDENPPPRGAPPQDPVRGLLDGSDDQPVVIDPGAPGPGSATRWVLDGIADDAEVRSALAAGGRLLVLPLAGRRRPLGVLAAVQRPGGVAMDHQPADGPDLTILRLIAHRIGLALDVARLYDREHRLAETLQRAMLPEQAHIPDLDVWTYYAPSSGHAQVGGDWYDVLQIDPDLVGVVVGDVVGHDVEAAAAMGQLKSVVRSYAFEGGDPDSVLGRVDELVAGMGVPRAASLVLATLRRAGETWSLRYSRAGHLPPVLARDGQAIELDEAAGSLVGFGRTPRESAEVTLRPGDVIVFYTDGLIERRRRPLRDGLDQLLDACAQLTSRDAAGVGEDLLSRLAATREDDVAVVVVRIPDPQADAAEAVNSPRRRRWLLPGEPASIARARHAVIRTAATWGIAGTSNAELVVSEMVANAVLHGWGHVTLRLFDTDDGLRIEVEDANPAPPLLTEGHPGRVGGYGMQIVERLADWGWRPTGDGKVVWAKVRADDDGGS